MKNINKPIILKSKDLQRIFNISQPTANRQMNRYIDSLGVKRLTKFITITELSQIEDISVNELLQMN